MSIKCIIYISIKLFKDDQMIEINLRIVCLLMKFPIFAYKAANLYSNNLCVLIHPFLCIPL